MSITKEKIITEIKKFMIQKYQSIFFELGLIYKIEIKKMIKK